MLARLAAIVVMLGGVARADDRTFVTLDRSDETSRAGVELSYVTMDDQGDGNARYGVRFEGHGQLIHAATGLGFYETVSYGLISQDNGSSDEQLGDVELGGVYTRPVGATLRVTVHVGATLPSAQAGDSDVQPLEVVFGSRIADRVLATDEAVTARLGGALLYRGERLFARLDVGFDGRITGPGRGRPQLRVAGGVGYVLGPALASAELTNLLHTSESRGENSLALAGRLRAGRLQPYAALILPLDTDAGAFTSGALTVGVDVLLP